jgi:hypothetical protein
MHIGLFISIIEDVLDRTRQQLEMERTAKLDRKSRKIRLSTLEPPSDAKRLRTRGEIAKDAAAQRTRRIQQKASFEVPLRLLLNTLY